MNNLLTQESAWRTFSGLSENEPLTHVLNLDEFERLARRRLPRPIYGYIAGAAETNAAHVDSGRAFSALSFVPRVLRNVSQRSQQCQIFGRVYAAPFGIAPMGIAALTAYDGDIVLARAASHAGIPFILSGASLTPLERVMKEAPDSWFQAYLPGDSARIDALLARLVAAGIRTLVLTVDVPVAGNRENNVRAGFSTPLRPSVRLAIDGLCCPRWLIGTLLKTLLTRGMPHFENSFAERGAPILSPRAVRDFAARDHFDWEQVKRIRDRWTGPLVLKGILAPADAALARQVGADGVIVSNHGGRQLDGAMAPLQALPGVVREAGGMTVMLDGAVRRGTDALKAIALGARMVFVGRPFNYAASVEGQVGVMRAIRILREEIDRNIAMLGVNRLSELDPSFVVRREETFPRECRDLVANQ